jgi:cytochrome bd-type quinol oxidase subunit 2
MNEFLSKIGSWFYDMFPSLLPSSTASNEISPEQMEQRLVVVGAMVIAVPLLLLGLVFGKKKRTYRKRKPSKMKRTYKRRKK